MTLVMNAVNDRGEFVYFVTKAIAITTIVNISAFTFSSEDLLGTRIATIAIHKADIIATFDGVAVPSGTTGVILGNLLTNGSIYTLEGNTNINNIQLISADDVTTSDVTITLGRLE